MVRVARVARVARVTRVARVARVARVDRVARVARVAPLSRFFTRSLLYSGLFVVIQFYGIPSGGSNPRLFGL